MHLLTLRTLLAALVLAIGGVTAEAGDAADRSAPATTTSAFNHIHQLIEQLGHPKFAEREAAARALLNIGLPAFGPLKEASQSPDAEIRFRAEKILAEVRQRDFHRRLQAFAANLDSDEDYDLPGWAEFRQQIGDTRIHRELFVRMQTDEPRLMQACEDGARAAGEALNIRALQLLQPTPSGTAQTVSLGTAAAMLFVAGMDEAPISDFGASGVYRICMDAVVRAELSGGPHQQALRELMSHWILREGNADSNYQKLTLAMQYDLKAGLTPAVQVLDQGAHPPHLRQQAMVAVAKFGDASHIPLLERYLTDETQYGTRRLDNQKVVQTEMRDVALAALVALTKQEFADYGLGHVTAAPNFVFIPYSCGFETPEARQKALQRWRDYRAKTSSEAPPAS